MADRPLRLCSGWVAPLLLAILIAAAILTWLDKWLYSNEVFNNLSMGLSYTPQNEILVHLRDEGLRYCDTFASEYELKACKIYQDAITDRLYFAHPLIALIGLQLHGLLDRPDSLTALHRIALEPPLIGAAIALPIWFFLTMAIPRSERTAAVVFMFLILFIGQCHDREYFPVPDLIHDAGDWRAPLTLIGVVTVSFWTTLRATTPGGLPGWLERLVAAAKSRNLFWLAIALYAISAIAPPMLNAIVAPLALLTLFAALVPLANRTTNLSPLLVAIAVALLFCAVTSEPPWLARKLGTAKGFAGLLYMAVIGLVTLRPRTRLVWLLPVITIFHVPLTALLGLATTIVELALWVRGYRAPGLLYASMVTFAIGIGVVLLGIDSTAFAPGSARFTDAVALALNWPGLPSALLSVAVVVSFALIPLRRVNEGTIALSRAGLLIAQAIAAALISTSILRQDPALLYAPGYALFTNPAFYITNTLLETGIFALLLTLLHSLATSEGRTMAGASRQPALLLLSALLLLTSASKLDLRLRNSYGPAPINLWRYVIAGELHPQWCRHLRHANLNDEIYYLSKNDPTNDAIIYWSAMKARLRIDFGVADPKNFVARPMPDDQSPCR